MVRSTCNGCAQKSGEDRLGRNKVILEKLIFFFIATILNKKEELHRNKKKKATTKIRKTIKIATLDRQVTVKESDIVRVREDITRRPLAKAVTETSSGSHL